MNTPTQFPVDIQKREWGIHLTIDNICLPSEAGLSSDEIHEATSKVVIGNVKNLASHSIPDFGFDFKVYQTGEKRGIIDMTSYRVIVPEGQLEKVRQSTFNVESVYGMIYHLLDKRDYFR